MDTMIKLLLPFLLVSCSWFEHHDEVETILPFKHIQDKRDFYVETIGDPTSLSDDRCDYLTFIGLADAYGFEVEIYDYEYPDGRWNRDTVPCYEVGDSRSGISTEGLLGAGHSLWAREDFEAVQRIIDYGNENNWVMHEGPMEYVFLPHLAPLFYRMLEHNDVEAAMPDFLDKIKGYKANVIADYLHLKGSVYGHLNSAEIEVLEELVEGVPSSPVFTALLHRYTDGNQYRSISILADDRVFPPDRLPETTDELWDWGDAPSAILYIWTVAILEGR